ncbi:hypothetical protein BH11MYX4_BH11MYX4_55250 [soil metagenome]
MSGRIFGALAALFVVSASATACSTTVNGADGSSGGSGPGSGGASSQQIDGCKESCNKMKFFGCNSAEQQAACYQDCGTATPSQIEVFTNCAGTSICDPACRTNITPKPAGGGPASGGGATASSCGTACDKLVACSFVKVGDKAGCLTVCQKEAYQYQIDCVNNTECGKIQSACGGGSSSSGGGSSGGGSSGGSSGGGSGTETISIARCQSACDSLHAQSCIDAANQAACRAKCTAQTTAKRDTFSSCVATSGACPEGNDCYAAF